MYWQRKQNDGIFRVGEVSLLLERGLFHVIRATGNSTPTVSKPGWLLWKNFKPSIESSWHEVVEVTVSS